MSTPVTKEGSDFLLDKSGREILIGDVLKVFHFIAARRRQKYYMYKQVVEIVPLGASGNPKHRFYKINHLEMNEGHYWERIDGRLLWNVEIVQGNQGLRDGSDFHDRPKFVSTVSD